MTIAAGEIIRAQAILDGLVTVGDKTAFTISSPAGSGWYRKVGPFVELFFATTANLGSGSTMTAVTLPAEFRPLSPVALAAGGGVGGDRPVDGQVGTDGAVGVRNNYSTAVPVQAYALYIPGV
jgi:hypothetical protein